MKSSSYIKRALLVFLVSASVQSVQLLRRKEKYAFSRKERFGIEHKLSYLRRRRFTIGVAQDPEFGFPLTMNTTFLKDRPQIIPLTVDTTSDVLWVRLSTDTCNETSQHTCRVPPGLTIDPGLTRYRVQWPTERLYRGKHMLQGLWYKGKIKLSNRIQAESQFFVTTDDNPVLSRHRGVLGLGMPRLRQNKDWSLNIWEALNHKQWDDEAFGFAIFPQATAEQLGQGGVITFGLACDQLVFTEKVHRVDILVEPRPLLYRKRDVYGRMGYYNVWQYWMKGGGFIIGHNDGTGHTTEFEDKLKSFRHNVEPNQTVKPWSLDTGSAYIEITDHYVVERFWHGISPPGRLKGRLFHVACNATVPRVTVYIGDTWKSDKSWHSWTLRPETLILNGPNGSCIAAMVKSREDFTILGLPFFRNGYINFNVNEGYYELAPYILPQTALDVQGMTYMNADGKFVF